MATVGVRKGFKFTAKSKPPASEKIVFDEIDEESTTTPLKKRGGRISKAEEDMKNDAVVKDLKTTEKKGRKRDDNLEMYSNFVYFYLLLNVLNLVHLLSPSTF